MKTGNVTNMARAASIMLGLCIALAARAEPSASVRLEINYLLEYIEESECEFNRNGTWHDAKAARAHIRTKYEYLLAKDLVETTEDFIERAATGSSVLFGKPYAIKCGANAPLPSSQWLSNELARYRALQPKSPM